MEKRVFNLVLMIFLLLMFLSGFGMSNFLFFEKISFGLWTKVMSYKMHNLLAWPSLILVFAHIWMMRRRF